MSKNWGGKRDGAGAPSKFETRRRVFAIWWLMKCGLPKKKAFQVVGEAIALNNLLDCQKFLLEVVYIWETKKFFAKKFSECYFLKIYTPCAKRRKNLPETTTEVFVKSVDNLRSSLNTSGGFIVTRLDRYSQFHFSINLDNIATPIYSIDEDGVDRELHPEYFINQSGDGFVCTENDYKEALDRVMEIRDTIKRDRRYAESVKKNWKMTIQRMKKRLNSEWQPDAILSGDLFSPEEMGQTEPYCHCNSLPIPHRHCVGCGITGLELEAQRFLFCMNLYGNDPCKYYNPSNPLGCNVDVCIRCANLKQVNYVHPLFLSRVNYGWMCKRCEEAFYKEHLRPKCGPLWGCEIVSFRGNTFLIILDEIILLNEKELD